MESALQYLQKYLAEPRLVQAPEEIESLMPELPDWWRVIFSSDESERVQRTLLKWEEYRIYFPSVVEFLSAHLRSVHLLSDKNRMSGNNDTRLLYEVAKSDGRMMYYAGGNPSQKTIPPSVADIWTNLPSDFTHFYDDFHDGWYYVASNSMGPSPSEDFFVLDDLEWGILDDIGDPQCDLEDLVAVYTNGMGGYVCLSIEGNRPYGNVLWWKDRKPRFNVDIWGVIDAWTEIGMNK
jgi:hypothetical protein